LVAKWFVEGVVTEASKASFARFGHLHDVARAKLTTEESSATLQKLEQEPTNDERIKELAEVLDSKIKADPDFANSLSHQIQVTRPEPQTVSFVTKVMDDAGVRRIAHFGTASCSASADQSSWLDDHLLSCLAGHFKGLDFPLGTTWQ
jgi:hypothetical protein